MFVVISDRERSVWNDGQCLGMLFGYQAVHVLAS